MQFNFMTKIKDTRRIALQKNVHNWYNCVLQSVMILFILSTIVSVYAIELVFGVDDSTPINEVPIIIFVTPFLFTMVLSYAVLDKLIILHILFYEKLHKVLFKAWQNFDMWYFRKYRKHSPLTENLSKLQARQAKLSKNKRRLIIGLLIAGFILFNIFVRIPFIIDSVEEQTPLPVIDQEQSQDQDIPKDNEFEIIIRGAG